MALPLIPILMGVGAAIRIGSRIIQHAEQENAYFENRRAANDAANNQLRLLNLRQVQEQEATKRTIFQMDLAARVADAEQRVAAGESGVSGASVDALIADTERQRLMARYEAEAAQKAVDAQIGEQRVGVVAQRDARVASVPRPNIGATLLGIAGDAAGAATQMLDIPGGIDIEAEKAALTKRSPLRSRSPSTPRASR